MKLIILSLTILFILSGCAEQPTPPPIKSDMNQTELIQYQKDYANYQEKKSEVDSQNATINVFAIVIGAVIGLALAL